MATATPQPHRFRPATDFPQQIGTLEREQADSLYVEMRECLIFTNRSRAQLMRRNTEHKDKALKLRGDLSHLQSLIDQLQAQKQMQLAEREAIIAQLAGEMKEMDTQLGTLSDAFDAVGDVAGEAQAQWGRLLFPARIMNLLKAVKALMQWYKKDDDPDLSNSMIPVGNTPNPSDGMIQIDIIDEQHRRDYPHQYTDQASINRDLLDR
jgi:hypothetical protein